jgi:Holliday junction resolvasome RuvABC endonuclease subunit
MKIIGLDISIRATGVAFDGGIAGLTTIRPRSKGDDRLVEITQAVLAVLLPHDPATGLVVLEDLPTGLRNAAAGSLGMVHGAVRAELIRLGAPYTTVPPATLKVYATGRGNAQKPDMRMELYKRAGLDVADDNQVDAWWLRALGLDLLGRPALDLPKMHRRALDKLVVPTGRAAA